MAFGSGGFVFTTTDYRAADQHWLILEAHFQFITLEPYT